MDFLKSIKFVMAVKVPVRDRNENRFTMKCRVVSTKYGGIAAEGQGVIVAFMKLL